MDAKNPMLLKVLFLWLCIQILATNLSAFSYNAGNAIPPPLRLKQLLELEMNGAGNPNHPILMPCVYDGLSARLVARAGFDATFMSGFGVSGVNGFPDAQLISYQEMVNAASTVAEGLASVALEHGTQATPIPCIADGDTGYGNAINVKRTLFGYGRAGMAGIMIEDQVSPKRCGHVQGKSVVGFDEAVMRVRAACDARDEFEQLYGKGTGPLVLARTDSLVTHGFEDAIQRCLEFRNVGCDITFLEAPKTVEQMREYCSRVSGPKLANMLEYGDTPILPPKELKEMGYTIAAYPLTLLSASIKAMEKALECIKEGMSTTELILPFSETKDVVGFTSYAQLEKRYTTSRES